MPRAAQVVQSLTTTGLAAIVAATVTLAGLSF
jgi:hypothetical protein